MISVNAPVRTLLKLSEFVFLLFEDRVISFVLIFAVFEPQRRAGDGSAGFDLIGSR
jgi:hypothetical protein